MRYFLGLERDGRRFLAILVHDIAFTTLGSFLLIAAYSRQVGAIANPLGPPRDQNSTLRSQVFDRFVPGRFQDKLDPCVVRARSLFTVNNVLAGKALMGMIGSRGLDRA